MRLIISDIFENSIQTFNDSKASSSSANINQTPEKSNESTDEGDYDKEPSYSDSSYEESSTKRVGTAVVGPQKSNQKRAKSESSKGKQPASKSLQKLLSQEAFRGL